MDIENLVKMANRIGQFFESMPDAEEASREIAEVFAIMARCPQHIFVMLTKRAGRMHSLLNSDSFLRLVAHFAAERSRDVLPIMPKRDPASGLKAAAVMSWWIRRGSRCRW